MGEKCLDNLAGCGGDSLISNRVTGERRMSKSSESGLPPLPEPIPVSSVLSQSKGIHAEEFQRASTIHCQPGILQEGCYYMRLMPTSLHTPARFQYEGTLRIQRTRATMIASSDLYMKDFCQSPTFCPSLSEEDERKNNIPVFPLKQYAYYLRVTHIQGDLDTGKDIVLELEPFRFQHATQTWTPGEPLTAEIKFSTGPDGVHYWRGDVQTRSKIVMGHMLAVWVSPSLRQAVIELDRVAASECPTNDEIGSEWRTIFKKAGWDVSVEVSDEDVEEPEDRSWSNAELHNKMLKYREKANLDKEWRYHLLAVQELDDKESFGVMYDNTINGLNDIPREGAAIASHVMIPDKNCWGKCKGKRFGECKEPYLRTAIHEIGHAMMLYHPDNPYENYIMQKSIGHSITMLWGTEGPLFPTSGYYRIVIELGWYLEGVRARVSGTTSVMVTPPKDDEHARAALKILSTHDALLAIAIGGDHLEAGYEVIRNAINHPVLKPHYNLIEAKRMGQRYFNRKPSLKETAEIVDEETVMSPTEVIRLTKILGNFAKETEKEVVEKISSTLLVKAKEVGVEEEVVKRIKEIQNQLDSEEKK